MAVRNFRGAGPALNGAREPLAGNDTIRSAAPEKYYHWLAVLVGEKGDVVAFILITKWNAKTK